MTLSVTPLTPSLYIRNRVTYTVDPTEFLTTAIDGIKTESDFDKNNNSGLFPISTADLSQWWYATEFSYKGNDIFHGIAQANKYAQANITDNGNIGIYHNSYENSDKTAYLVDKVNLYTKPKENMKIFFAPDNPIRVAYKGNDESGVNSKDEKRILLEALRIGVKADEGETIIYACKQESGVGNDSNISAEGFYGVTRADSVKILENVITDSYNPYTAVADTESTTGFSAVNGHNPIGIIKKDGNGLDVDVYAWLEGTDAQALIGSSDDDIKGITVNVSFVGVLE